MSKFLASVLVVGVAGWFVMLSLFTTYAEAFADEFGIDMDSSASSSINISSIVEDSQTQCVYPRYRYDAEGRQTQYKFFLDNLDCDISVGALGESFCNSIAGCSWSNTTTGFLFWSSQTQTCTGQINKTFYNDGVETDENICDIDGLQGDDNMQACLGLGCSIYEPSSDLEDGKYVTPIKVLTQFGNLFSFRYDFGLGGFWALLTTIILVYFPTILLIIGIYIMSPLSL